jgi:hypothetical protein
VGTLFSVRASSDGGAVTYLLEGRLRVRSRGSDEVVMVAGQALTLGDRGPRPLDVAEASAVSDLVGVRVASMESRQSEPTGDERAATSGVRPAEQQGERPHRRAGQRPPASPSEMLRRARALRLERRYVESAEEYREIQRSFPSSAEARASLVSLGQLQLAHLGAAEAALRSFDAYLASGGGSLELEARQGRIGALRALGRAAEERAAIEAFLNRFPSAANADALGRRLEALRAEPRNDR